ncbi:ATP-binding protein [Verrucomicrobiota bacterium]
MSAIRFKRLVLNDLEDWRSSENRKPLVLRGARQVGKTVAARMFGKTYNHFAEMNLETKEHSALFQRIRKPAEIIQAVKLLKGIPPKEKEWLLFLDEIQACPEAVASLRYFYEDIPEVHVLAAGSLLETALQKKHISFPVGRVDFRYLYPMSFEEFLGALGNSNIKEVFQEVPSPAYAYDQLLSFFHQYALVGGFPEAVARYAETRDITAVNQVYESLFSAYIDDVSKYARNTTMTHILKHCLKSAPAEAGTRIKFAGFGSSNYGSREIGEALRTLEQVMLLSLLYPTVSTSAPFLPNMRKSPRLQFVDTGLMQYLAGTQQDLIGIDDLSAVFRGRILEQLTGQELMSRYSAVRRAPLFWVRNKPQSQAELDFLDVRGTMPVPVEVKSGSEGKLRSLHRFMEMQQNAEMAIRLYRGTFIDQTVQRAGRQFRLLNVPYYHASKVGEYCDPGWWK